MTPAYAKMTFFHMLIVCASGHQLRAFSAHSRGASQFLMADVCMHHISHVLKAIIFSQHVH